MHKLLIVDDSELCRKPFRSVGRDESGTTFLEILEADTGEDGLTQFKKHPDIVYAIVDVHLPGITGFTMLERMKAFDPERYNKLRIFMTCTEMCSQEDELRQGHAPQTPASIDDDSVSWLVKPIHPEKFGQFLFTDYNDRG